MKKSFALFIVLALLTLGANSQEADHSDYSGFALGVYNSNYFIIGDFANFAFITTGGEIDAEYTFPRFIPANIDLGVSLRSQFNYVSANKNTTLKRDFELIPSLGLFLRIPFENNGCHLAFQPEVAFAYALHFLQSDFGSPVSSFNADPGLLLSAGLRWDIPCEKNDSFEFELAPVYLFAPESRDFVVNQFGFRFGVIWHIQNFFQNR